MTTYTWEVTFSIDAASDAEVEAKIKSAEDVLIDVLGFEHKEDFLHPYGDGTGECATEVVNDA